MTSQKKPRQIKKITKPKPKGRAKSNQAKTKKIRIGQHQKKIIEALELGTWNINELTSKIGHHPSHTKRMVEGLVERKVIYQNDQELVFLGLKRDLRSGDAKSWADLWKDNFFIEEGNKLVIKSLINFQKIIDLYKSRNQSLMSLKNTNPNLYLRLTKSLAVNLENQLSQLSNKIYYWSNERFFLEIKEHCLSLKNSKNNKTVELQKTMPNQKYIFDSIVLLNQSLQEIKGFIISLSSKDYSGF